MRKSHSKKWVYRGVMSIAGLMIFMMGIGNMILQVRGKLVTAKVTGYEQVLFLSNDDASRNPSRYRLEYQFTVEEVSYRGSVTRVFKEGSHMRETLPIRYLSIRPSMNAEDSSKTDFIGLGMMLGGVFIFSMAFRQ